MILLRVRCTRRTAAQKKKTKEKNLDSKQIKLSVPVLGNGKPEKMY